MRGPVQLLRLDVRPVGARPVIDHTIVCARKVSVSCAFSQGAARTAPHQKGQSLYIDLFTDSLLENARKHLTARGTCVLLI